MKKVIRSNTFKNGWSKKPQFINYKRNKFSVYDKYEEDPMNYQCQVSEIHPYDLADYAWARKDSPSSAVIIKSGRIIKTIPVPEYDEDIYEHDWEYFQEVTETIFDALIDENKNVKPMIDHT